jgi:integrase
MRLPTYVYRSRHGIYFFRIVVPLALRNALSGQREIKRSLRTRDKRQALVQARALALDLYPVFAKAAAMTKFNNEPSIQDVLAAASNGRKLTITGPQVMPDGSTIPYTIKTDTDSPRELEAAKSAAVKLHALHHTLSQNRPKEPTEEEWALFEKEQKLLRDILLSDIKTETRTASVAIEGSAAGAAQPVYNDPKYFIGVLWVKFATQQQGAEWRAPRTFKANNRMFNTFLEWAGDRDVRTINRVLISEFKDYLRSKVTVQAGKRKGELGLDSRTVDNHTLILNKFLEWAQNGGYFHEGHVLPTSKQVIVSKQARRMRALKSNPAYTIEQLKTVFDAKVFHPKLAHHFWPPLIALFTGGRRREIAQLLLSDFFVTDGIHAMSINMDGDETQSIKTAAAKRTIPVHPALIELGLLGYLDDVKALGLSNEVFPGISANINGEKGNAVGHAWARHLEAVGIKQSSLHTYHSFRSTAITVLKKAKVPIDMRSQLVGHEFDHVGEGYTDKFTVTELFEEAIPKLVYEGLDLSSLRYTHGQFDESNKASHRQRVIDEKGRTMKEADARRG